MASSLVAWTGVDVKDTEDFSHAYVYAKNVFTSSIGTNFNEAIEKGSELIIVHHPLIFSPLKSIKTDSNIGKIIQKLIQNDIFAQLSFKVGLPVFTSHAPLACKTRQYDLWPGSIPLLWW